MSIEFRKHAGPYFLTILQDGVRVGHIDRCYRTKKEQICPTCKQGTGRLVSKISGYSLTIDGRYWDGGSKCTPKPKDCRGGISSCRFAQKWKAVRMAIAMLEGRA